MKQLLSLFILLILFITVQAQFPDTSTLNQYIRDTIKDKKPNKITAEQMQKALLGMTGFISNLNNTATIYAKGISASASVSNYGATRVDSLKYKFSTAPYGTGGEYGGWLTPNLSGDSIKVTAPFWVIIGDSQAEGHPDTHGRLHPTIDLTKTDVPGQLSYHLRALTNMRFFNHGIGGQTSSQVWARWDRDVLGKTVAGVTTLNNKPQGVIIIAGINDFYSGISVTQLKENLTKMAASAAMNGIYCVILNIPGDELNNATQNAQVSEINRWLAGGALNNYNAVIVDYNSWWRDPSFNDNAHANDNLITDDIHPSQTGYSKLADYIFEKAKLPVLKQVIISTEISPNGFTGYSRPSAITINKTPYTISKTLDTLTLSNYLDCDTVNVKINTTVNATGTSYTGFSHIDWVISYRNDANILARGQNSASQTLYPLLTTSANGNIGIQTTTPTTPVEINTSISRKETINIGELRTYLNLAGGQSPNSHFAKGGFYIILPDGVDQVFYNMEIDVTDATGGGSKIFINSVNHKCVVGFLGDMGTYQPAIRIVGTGGANQYIIIGDSTYGRLWDFTVMKISRLFLYAGFNSPVSYDTVKVRFTTAPISLANSISTSLFPIVIRNTMMTGETISIPLDFPSTPAQSSSEINVAVPGAIVGNPVFIGTPIPAANTFYNATIIGDNVVSVRFNNYSNASVDPPLGTFKIVAGR